MELNLFTVILDKKFMLEFVKEVVMNPYHREPLIWFG